MKLAFQWGRHASSSRKISILNRMKNYKIKQKGIESGMVRWGEVIVDGWLEQEMTSEQRIE